MFAHIATVSLRRTTFGGYPRDTETVTTERRSIATGGVRDTWRPIRLESAQKDTGGAARCECQ